jgi:hypothetical protein
MDVMNRIRWASILPAIAVALLTLSCATGKPKPQDFMPAPGIYGTGEFDPFREYGGWPTAESTGVLFATTRKEAAPEDPLFYLNERDVVLSLGAARVEPAGEGTDCSTLENMNLLEGKNSEYPISVSDVETFGYLEDALHGLVNPDRLPEDRGAASRRFAEIIEDQLAGNPLREITIYVHGFYNRFDEPILVATELWHYLGYRGTFIAFSWPSEQSAVRYFSDVDSAEYTAIGLRKLILFLARETSAEKINVIAHSAGTKLLTLALYQIALEYGHLTEEERLGTTKLGKVIYAAGDVERPMVGQLVDEGGDRILESITVYMSGKDGALRASKSIRRQPRMGQTWAQEEAEETVRDFVRTHEKLIFIDVTDAEGSHGGQGHSYFRMNPWVSSDILAHLAFGLDPAARGLVRRYNQVYWSFPDDYLERLGRGIAGTDYSPE